MSAVKETPKNDVAARALLALRALTKTMYRTRGLARIAEAARRLFAGYARPVVISDFDGDLQFKCRLDRHMGSQIFWRGFYSAGQIELLKKLFKPEFVFADVGANHGEFTLLAAKYCGLGQVIAFEPVPEAVEELRGNIALNGFGNITVCAFGLGDKQAKCQVYSQGGHFADGTDHEGLFTVYPSSQRQGRVCEIDLKPMDDADEIKALSRLDVIKIDVEGSELAVLRGAGRTISRFRPLIVMEVSEETCRAAGYAPEDICGHLKSISYRWEVISDSGETAKPEGSGKPEDFANIVCYPE